MSKRYGYYSQKSIDAHESMIGRTSPASVWYTTPGGGKVLVTSVGEAETPLDGGYMWDDAVCVGEVSEYAGRGPS